jgi:small subunit ribosomal protein S3
VLDLKFIKNIKKILPSSRQLTINVFEVEKVDLNASLLADLVAEQLEKRIAFRRAIREALQRAQKQNVNGIKIQVSGRLNGAEIARSEWIREGRVPYKLYVLILIMQHKKQIQFMEF